MRGVYLSKGEADGLSALLMRVGARTLREVIGTPTRVSLLRKLRLDTRGQEVVPLDEWMASLVCRSHTFSDGMVLLVMETSPTPFFWYKLLSSEGDEIASGMYTLSPDKAEEEGMVAWCARKVSIAQEEKL